MNNKNIKKIFVTGVAGFLGSHLSEKLLEQGHQIVGVDNLVGGYTDNIPKGIKFYEYDWFILSNLTQIPKLTCLKL